MTLSVVTIPLRDHLAAKPDAIIETVAKEFNVTVREALEALPEPLRRFAAGESFVDVMTAVATWGPVTLIIHSENGVMEFSGPIPTGSVGHGYYNLAGSTGFHGHLRHDRCVAIAFVERPLFGRPSASIIFFDPEGGTMFKIFVGRDEKRELLPDQMTAFRALAQRLCQTS